MRAHDIVVHLRVGEKVARHHAPRWVMQVNVDAHSERCPRAAAGEESNGNPCPSDQPTYQRSKRMTSSKGWRPWPGGAAGRVAAGSG